VIGFKTEPPPLRFTYERRGFAYDRRGDANSDNEDVRNQSYDRAIADFTEVIRIYTEVIRLDPTDAAWAWYSRGRIKRKKGDVKGSQADIAAAKAIDPNVDK
jgi:tetratricopeptide (TPR) repeat protein